MIFTSQWKSQAVLQTEETGDSEDTFLRTELNLETELCLARPTDVKSRNLRRVGCGSPRSRSAINILSSPGHLYRISLCLSSPPLAARQYLVRYISSSGYIISSQPNKIFISIFFTLHSQRNTNVEKKLCQFHFYVIVI